MDPVPVKPAQHQTLPPGYGPCTRDLGRSFFFLFSVLMLLAVMIGCGVKAMPTAPGEGPLPSATDLSHELDGGYVYLKWQVPMDISKGKAVVSRARTKLGEEMCDGCPLVFQEIAVLEINPQRSSLTQTCREQLAPGFRYTYRVVIKGKRGRTSAPSNLVTFDY